MKKMLLAAAAAALIAIPAMSIGTATDADAQVRVRAGENGVAVRVGPGVDRHRHRDVRRGYARSRDCRTVRSRTVTPGGKVIGRTRKVCRYGDSAPHRRPRASGAVLRLRERLRMTPRCASTFLPSLPPSCPNSRRMA